MFSVQSNRSASIDTKSQTKVIWETKGGESRVGARKTRWKTTGKHQVLADGY